MTYGHVVDRRVVTTLASWAMVLVAVLALTPAALAQDYTSVHSFTAGSIGSHPNTLTYGGGVITVDMNALPAGTQCFRAHLITQRGGNTGSSLYDTYAPVQVEAADDVGNYLPFVEPRRVNLDCTAAAQRALGQGDRTLTLNVLSFVGLGTGSIPMRVDVWCDEPAASAVTQVTNLAAVHSGGDTRLTFTEVNSPITASSITLDQYNAAVSAMDNTTQVRYRVYRSTVPLTATSIRAAELVDEIKPLTCWNPGYLASGASGSSNVPRLAVTDLAIVPAETGIYVYRAQAGQSAYYAVSRVVDGQEDLSNFTAAHALTSPVAESVGSGAVVRQRIETPASFQYVDNPTLNYYVRWECPPTCNLPSSPYDYLVAVPNVAVSPRPVDLALHCWGGSLDGGYGWWYRAEDGALLVASNQIPYDWWTSYHENYGTAGSFSSGHVYNYTQLRLESFVDNFVKLNYTVDNNRILLSGNSMGGSGSSLYGMKNGDRFAYIVSWVGVHRPHMSPQFTGSFEACYGKLAWDCPYYTNDMPTFDYEDNVTWLNDHPTTETPYIAFANGKNDSAIGWPQAVDYVNALIATKRPFNFSWGQSGHSERAALPGEGGGDRYIGMDIALNGPLPAFANCSLDENYGNGDPLDGDLAGQVNGYLFWEPATVVDTATQFEMTCKLESVAPQSNCTVTMTPRRATGFVLSSGTACTWTNTDQVTLQEIQSGGATADSYGLVTITGLVVSKNGNRVVITTGGAPADTTAPSDVTNLAVINATENTVELTWTAPGDDGSTGTATSYDIRYSTSTIDAGNWASATPVSGEPSPLPAGTAQSMVIGGLGASTTYYFAMKASDEVPNESGLSNVATATTLSTDTTPPALVSATAISANSVNVLFSEPVEQASAQNTANYAVDNGVTVNSATLNANLTTVTLNTTAIATGTTYTLTVNNIRDRATSPNTIAANSQATFSFAGNVLVLQQNLNGYAGVEDTWFEYFGEGAYYSRGAMDHLRFWDPIELGAGRKIVVRFDLTDLDTMLPPGVTITSATLALYQYGVESPNATTTDSVEIAPMLRAWVEGGGTGYFGDPITGANYYYWQGAIRNPSGWVQNATYTNVWQLDVTGQTVHHCQFDVVWSASTWVQSTSVADVAAGVRRWYQSGDTLYVNKDDSTTQDPTASTYGFSYFLDTDLWDGVAGTGAADVDISSKIAASWPNYDQTYDPGNPGALDGPADWVEVDITSFVTAWQAQPSANHGVMIAENDIGVANPQFARTEGRFFRSSEYDAGGGDYTFGPKLVITYAEPPDTTAPAAVADLSADTPTETTINLAWTAPGDDDTSGTASTYDLRYSTSVIDEGNWASASQATGEPSPAVAGTVQNTQVTGLTPGTLYYFAIKTADEVPNVSGLSNVVSYSTVTPPDTTAPAVVTDLATGAVTSSTVDLTWTAPGDDGTTGTASSYDVRYSTSPIDAGNWTSATMAAGEPAPSAAGSAETMQVTGLSGGTLYYFAIKASDEVPNESGLSNVVTATTQTAFAYEGTIVEHIPTNVSAWHGANNVSASYGKIQNWPNGTADGTLAQFDRTELQNAISAAIGTYGDWTAKVVVTQPNWDTSGQPAADLAPMVASVQIDPGTLVWGSSYAYDAGAGAWTYNSTTYSDFASAVLAGVGVGDSVVLTGAAWQANWNTGLAAATWDIAINVPQSLISAYINNTSAVGLFVGAEKAAAAQNVFSGDQWGGAADIRVVIGPPLADTTAPAAVTDLATSSATETTMDLTWTAPGDDDTTGTATSYDVRYSTSVIDAGNFASATQVTGEPTPQVAGSVEAMQVTGLTAGTLYYFAMTASDEVPNESALSNVVSASTVEPPDTTAPAAVADLATSNPTETSIDLTWTAPGDDDSTGTATSYDVRYSTSVIDAGNFASATQATGVPTPQVAGSAESMTVTGLSAETTYYFAIKTSDEVPNESALSNVASGATTEPPDVTAPDAIADLSVSNVAATTMWLTWTAPGDDGATGTATSYDVRYSTSPIDAGSWAAATQATGESTPQAAGATETFVLAGLSAETTYYVAVTASDEVPNESGLSNVVSATTEATSAYVGTLVQHISGNASAWRGGNNISPTYGKIQNWPSANADGTLAEFDRVALQNAIDGAIVSYGDWDAKIIVSQVTWNTVEPPADLAPVAVSAQIDPGTLVWGSSTAYDAGSGLWTYNSTTYADFASAILAGAGASDSVVVTGLSYQTVWNTSLPGACWDIVIDVPETLISDYIANASAIGLFVGAEKVNADQDVFAMEQWNGEANIRVLIGPKADTTAPVAVADLAGSNPTATSVDLTWTAPGDDGATGTATSYDVRYSTSAIDAGNFASATQVIGEPTPQVAGSAEGMTVSGLSSDTTYYFAMTTSDEVPNESALSNVVSVTTPDVTAPNAVADLATGSVTVDSVQLTWTAPGDDADTGTASSYDVRYSTSVIDAGNFAIATQATGEPAPQVAGSAESFTVTGLTADTLYYFAVRVSDEVPNESAISNVVSGSTVTPPDTTAPADVVDLSTGTVTSNTVSVSWTAPGDDASTGTASSYDVRYSTSAIDAGNWAAAIQATGEPSPSVAGSAETMQVTGLSPGTLYYFAIKTSDEVPNESGLSNVVSATTSNGTVWNVSNVAELENAVANYASGDEIILAAGTYSTTNRLYFDNGGLTFHGATGNRDDVIISGPGMNVNAEPTEMIDVSSSNITIEDLTIRDTYYHGVHVRGESNVDNITIRNVRTLNCGERHLKFSWNGATPSWITENVIIENCLMEQTQALSNHADNDYIGGIDAMGLDNWTVRDNVAIGIQGVTGGARAAIFFWHHATNFVLERNQIYDCDRGIALGNPGWAEAGPTCYYGIVRNNFLARGAGISIELAFVADMKVYYNTIYSDDCTYFRTIHIYDTDGRTNNLAFAYNIIRGEVFENSTGSWTYTGDIIGCTPDPTWFVNTAVADLHLTASASAAIDAGASLAEVTDDFDQQTRDATPDIGADEYTGADVTAPDAVTDLATGSVTAGSVGLTWTAPGDDGSSGTASSYDIRYSTSTIDEGNWAAATQATGEPAPQSAGSVQSFTVTGLSPDTTYFFGIKTSDEAANESGVSNVPSATTTSVPQTVIVQHVTDHTSGWRGGLNISPTYGWLQNWPNANADGTLGEFDPAALQTAIDNAMASYGGWDAKVIVTQVNWITDPIPADLAPVVVSVDIDPSTLVWGSSNVENAGAGSWMYGGSAYANFVAAVNAGAAAGDSVIVTGAPWQGVWDTSLPTACWNVEVDVPEALIRAYLDNPSSDAIFVGAEKSDGDVDIFYGDQWSQQANVRVSIGQPPQTAPWIVLDTYAVDSNVSLTDPTPAPTTVTVTNAGTGSLAWSAAEVPAVAWLSLSGSSGGDGGSFDIQIDVTGQSEGTYTTTIEVTDPAANNTPQVIEVSVTVLATPEPIIDLVPSQLDVSVSTLDSPPAPIAVTVNNIGLGSLAWTASESPDQTWMSLTSVSGSDGDAFDVTIDHSGLARGSYVGTIQVSDPAATNDPVNLTVNLEVRDQDADITIANSYDDAWESGPTGWVETCKALDTAWSGTVGFVVHMGDSITYANSYGQWARYGAGKTQADSDICNWMHSSDWPAGGNDSANGWYLAAWDMPGGRSYTAESGIRADQYLVGAADLPSTDEMFTPGFTNPDGEQYTDAEIAIVMLGTNDASSNRTPAAMIADLEAIVDKLLAQNIIVCLSTLPPKSGDMTDVQNYNVEIRALAQTKALPMIDFYEEVLRRRPGTSWDGTLISGDGVHPSSSGGGYGSADSPYTNNGEPLSYVGYLLRDWLSVQKIQEIKQKVIDGGPVDTTAPDAITDLAASNPGSNSVDLAWTAPGDDGAAGTASSYDVRYSTASINEANWASATQATGEPSPSVAGSAESFTVTGLSPGTTYYFAVKTSDEASNEAALSNVVSETTAVATPQTWNVTNISELENAMRNYNGGDEILIAAGTYILDAYIVLDGGQVLFHGATGNPDDVVLQGPGINTDVNPREGIVVGSDNVTIEDLTVQDVFWNGIHIQGENGVDATTIRNVKLYDCGERYIKGSTNSSDVAFVVDNVLIENVYMEQTQDLSSAHPDMNYVGGIDAMGINNWTIRDCTAVNIHGGTGGGRGGIFLWQGVGNPTVERNVIINCDRGIAMGNAALPTHVYTGGTNHVFGGIVRNNFIVRGVGIGLELSYTADLKVYNNTIYSDDASYWRTVQIYDSAGQTSNLIVGYNIIRGVLDESSAGGTYTLTSNITGSNVWPSWFVDPLSGDLHLTNQATPAFDAAASLPEVTDDIDSDVRSAAPDIGADETAFSPPVIAFDVTSASGDESTTTVNVLVAMDRTHGYTSTVDFAVTGGDAVDPDDYTISASPVTFTSGVTQQYIVITIVNEAVVEGDETIEITLSNPTNATLGANTVYTYTIINDDMAATPVVAFDATSSSGAEGVTTVNVSVSLDAAYGEVVTVDFAVTGGTAVDPDDYTISASPVTFNPGVTQQDIVITVVDDGVVEADETVEVTLSNPSNAVLGANTVHTYTINNDDAYPTVAFDLTSSSGDEDVATVNVSVSLDAAYGEVVTVDFAVTGGTAVDPDDYSIAASPLTFGIGVTQQNVVITVVDDGNVESDETVEVTLSNPSNATLGGNTVHTYTILDDDVASLPGQATNPSPYDGQTSVNRSGVTLSWTPGAGATSHDVYFGTDSTPDSGEFMGNQTGTTFSTGSMSRRTWYYWRIDEVNANGTTTGVVWSFRSN